MLLDPTLHVLWLLFHDVNILWFSEYEFNGSVAWVENVQVFLPACVAECVDANLTAGYEIVRVGAESFLKQFF